MRLKVSYERPDRTVEDVQLSAELSCPVGSIAEELICSDPRTLAGREVRGAVTLAVAPPQTQAFEVLTPDKPLGESHLASGFTVRVVQVSGQQPSRFESQTTSITVVIRSGDLNGQTFTLPPGSRTIGRKPINDLVINDPLVSGIHARVIVGSTPELVDLNSANGILVDGALVPRLRLTDGQQVTIGDTTLEFRIQRDLNETSQIFGASIPFNRSPRVESRYPGREYTAPEVPSELEKPTFPWIMMVMPVVLGVAMFIMTQRAASLLFVVMSPMMMLGNYWMSRRKFRQDGDSAVAVFTRQLDSLEQELAEQLPLEQSIRVQEAPTCAEVQQAMRNRSSLLWTRRPEHWSFLNVRLGTGSDRSRNTVVKSREGAAALLEYADKVDAIIDRFAVVDGVPILESPDIAGCIGVVGPQEAAFGLLRGLLLQWVGLHSPAELVVTVLGGPTAGAELDWLKWLPHTSSTQSPISGNHLADTVPSNLGLITQLEQLLADRLKSARIDGLSVLPPLEDSLRAVHRGAKVGQSESDGSVEARVLPAILCVVTSDALVDKGRVITLLEHAAGSGIVPVVVAPTIDALPAACRTFLEVRPQDSQLRAAAHFVRHGRVVPDLAVETVSREDALTLAKSMSALTDVGAPTEANSDLPRSVSLVTLLGSEYAMNPPSIIDRWRQNLSFRGQDRPKGRRRREPNLRALVGKGALNSMHLDLRGQGPHALVAGTTGAGKSEFLKSWVLGMATEFSPDRVTFLFVDYKGGSAFAECVRLPHKVGVVTDLTPHLARRALISLGAEVKKREHLVNDKGAKDILDLEERSDPDCPPALVIVIDEFAALAREVPTFVDGVIDIAQRGRSLGIHLIMATQRPAGVITPALRANTNLRVALRMSDTSESTDVVDIPDAAKFDPSIKGRALAKTGPGQPQPFQSAYVGGWTTDVVPEPVTTVTPLRFGAEKAWERPEDEEEVPENGPTDEVRLVNTIISAAEHSGITPPRRPWHEELQDTYNLQALLQEGPLSDEQLIFGWVDLPKAQDQQAVAFEPDRDGHLLVYGTSGSGKSVLLRSLAAAAGVTPLGGPVHVYGLDFAGGGLTMLEDLPHVGAVIASDDNDRTVRLLRTLTAELDRRRRDYSAVRADSIVSYRSIAGMVAEPRIVVLLDGYPAFRNDYETGVGRANWYAAFQQILTEGRQLGIHVVMSADRPASVPGAVAANVSRRVVLRMADEGMYTVLDVPTDVLDGNSPPGRALVDKEEAQVAILGGDSGALSQDAAMSRLSDLVRAEGRAPAPPIQALPEDVNLIQLPRQLAGQPVIGIADDTLGPVTFEPQGPFVVAGGPQSGRSTALVTLVSAINRAMPEMRLVCLTARPSGVASEPLFHEVLVGVDAVKEAAARITAELEREPQARSWALVVESLSDFLQTPADGPLVTLFKAARRTSQLIVAESETTTWSSSYGLYGELKAARTGLILQPEPLEADVIFKAGIPRLPRSEFPPGRGYLIKAGRAQRIQLARLTGHTSSP
ncbi:MAG: FHA domain-containing protein [Actinomycetales bacterium]|nr:FHA domain-containing protein [Actinomycetales bacterium]